MNNDFHEYSAAFQDHQNDLAHFGIKGMKWKHRKRQPISLADRRKEGANKIAQRSSNLYDTSARMQDNIRSGKLKNNFEQKVSNTMLNGIGKVLALDNNRSQKVSLSARKDEVKTNHRNKVGSAKPGSTQKSAKIHLKKKK